MDIRGAGAHALQMSLRPNPLPPLHDLKITMDNHLDFGRLQARLLEDFKEHFGHIPTSDPSRLEVQLQLDENAALAAFCLCRVCGQVLPYGVGRLSVTCLVED